MNRRQLMIGAGVAVVAIALGSALMSGLFRVLRNSNAPSPIEQTTVATPTPDAAAAVPRIKATLYFGSEDGRYLVPVEQEIPLAEDTVGQARAVVEAQLTATAAQPLAATIPPNTKLRGLYLSEKNEAFVDLDSSVRTTHPGGSMNELFTVYTIVNAVITNIPDVQGVQVLIDGREVDTLAGHVDLRRPLRKNESLIAP